MDLKKKIFDCKVFVLHFYVVYKKQANKYNGRGSNELANKH